MKTIFKHISLLDDGESLDLDKPSRPSLSMAVLAGMIIWAMMLLYTHVVVTNTKAPETYNVLPDGIYQGIIVGDGYESDFSNRYIFKTKDASGSLRKIYIDVDTDITLYAHQYIKAYIHVNQFKDESDFKKALQRNIFAKGRAQNIEVIDSISPIAYITKLRIKTIESFNKIPVSGAGMACALTTGNRNLLVKEASYEELKDVGLAHVVAISGAHVSFVVAFLQTLLQYIRASRKSQFVFILSFLLTYSIFSGLTLPVLRATMMTLVVISSFIRKRRAHALSALGVAICIILVVDPWSSRDISFILSVLATFSIVLFLPWFRYIFKILFGRLFESLQEVTALTISAHIGIFPIVASLFSRIPLISPFSNLIAGPFITSIMGIGLLGSLIHVISPQIGTPLLHCAAKASAIFQKIIHALAYIPGASTFVDISLGITICISAALALILWLTWPTVSKKTLLLSILLLTTIVLSVAVIEYMHDPDKITILDVGQGDAILVQSNHTAFLIDTGTQDVLLMQALARQHIHHIDGVVITHHDDDHYGSLPILKNKLTKSYVYVSECMTTHNDESNMHVQHIVRDTTRKNWITLHAGCVLHIGNFQCTVVWPQTCLDAGGNSDSLSLYIAYDNDADGVAESTILTIGDAEDTELSALVQTYDIRDIDILKVGHHGSKKSISATTAAALNPRIACISVGANNRYGHPAKNTLEILEEQGSIIYRSDIHSDIMCTFKKNNIQVSTIRKE